MVRRRFSGLTSVLIFAALAGGAGCVGHVKPATGHMRGLLRPALLSRVDRIGGGKPAAVREVGSFEGESRASLTQSSNQYYSVTTDITDNTGVLGGAATALVGKPKQAELRIETLRARSFGWPAGIASRVYVEGIVVLPTEAP